jgi:hypothetical protein
VSISPHYSMLMWLIAMAQKEQIKQKASDE